MSPRTQAYAEKSALVGATGESLLRTLGAVLLSMMATWGSSAFAESSDPTEVSAVSVAESLGMTPRQVQQVRSGEIVSVEIPSASNKDLAVALVAVIDAPVEQAGKLIRAGLVTDVSETTLAEGVIDLDSRALLAFSIPEEVAGRIRRLRGDAYFWSDRERASLERLDSEPDAGALSAWLKSLMRQRAEAYWRGGVGAIEPYAGDGRSAGADLAHANEAARALVGLEELGDELEGVPADQTSAAQPTMFWALERGRDVLAPVLGHRMTWEREDGWIMVERRFYSGYDYDALQIVAGLLPDSSDRRSIVFYSNHTFTAQVTGLGGRAKRAVGRRLMERRLVEEIERVRAAIAASASGGD
ncbi:MAG: hypothetical protein AAGC67_02300 [Myxococcota bacterium]